MERDQNREFGRDVVEERLCRKFFSERAKTHCFSRRASLSWPLACHELFVELFMRGYNVKFLKIICFSQQKKDATGKSGASTDIKINAPLLMLQEGKSARSLLRQLRMREPLCMECMRKVTKSN